MKKLNLDSVIEVLSWFGRLLMASVVVASACSIFGFSIKETAVMLMALLLGYIFFGR
ncbi:hypothetical protein [Pseudoalteromonas sp.]|uniref:hypothetical protein n=1 Tax=Pseudoalteromonas sp. TaxID=53249 RepID=UPI002729D3CE|nr:hypothetical protein [Pseudoalteromonas sp.]